MGEKVIFISTFKFLSGQILSKLSLWAQFKEFQENIFSKVIMEKCTFNLTTVVAV